MSKFFTKVKNWFISHKPTKRRLIQVYAALLYNANIKGFATGKIYTGDTKKLCVPGLNCYSCPGAIGACPLGALQDSLANSKT
ncbi:MAG: 4Fe-4S binding protein, partial [Candidatus Coproplasma sp.]